MIKFVFDIQTKQIVYAVCDVNHQCHMITTDITKAIQAIQK
jgi:hypothetical protein